MAFQDLFRPRWRNSDWQIRLKAVREISDRFLQDRSKGEIADRECEKLDVLAKIAASDGRAEVREAASDALDDIAKNSKYGFVQRAAVKLVAHQSVLADIAKYDGDAQMRGLAVKLVTDPTLLADIAKHQKQCEKHATGWFEYLMAGKCLQRYLADFAKNDPVAVTLVTDQGLKVIGGYLRHLAMEWWANQPESRTSSTCDACSVRPVSRNDGYLIGSYLWCKDCYASKDVKGQFRRNPTADGGGMLLQALEWAGKHYAANDGAVPALRQGVVNPYWE